jgi:hypothetical protein
MRAFLSTSADKGGRSGGGEQLNKSPAEEDDKKLAGQVWLSYPSFHLHCLIDLSLKNNIDGKIAPLSKSKWSAMYFPLHELKTVASEPHTNLSIY